MTTTDLVRPSTASVGIGVLSGVGATALGVLAASPPLVATDGQGSFSRTPVTGGVGFAIAAVPATHGIVSLARAVSGESRAA